MVLSFFLDLLLQHSELLYFLGQSIHHIRVLNGLLSNYHIFFVNRVSNFIHFLEIILFY